MKSNIIALIFTFLSCLQAVAQVTISGKVTDDADAPIEFATVRVMGTAIGTNTQKLGFFFKQQLLLLSFDYIY